jgi:hypothetical protein
MIFNKWNEEVSQIDEGIPSVKLLEQIIRFQNISQK